MSNKVPKHKPSLRAQAQAQAEAAARAERRRNTVIGVIVGLGLVVLVVGTIGLLVASSGGDEAPEASPDAVALGCVSCHSVDGARSEGPTWAGLWGSEVRLTDGSTVLADEAYIRTAITDPHAQVAAGFSMAMPEVEVTPEEVDRLVAYIESLADEG